MPISNSIKLHGLSTREAIADALYRIMSGFDENNAELLQSGMTPNVVLEMNGNEIVGFENVKKHSFGTVGPMDTTHFVTNVRIAVQDDKSTTARMTANTLAQHYPQGMGATESVKRLLGGSKHELQLVKDEDDGLWKAKRWTMKTVWHEGDFSVMQPPSA